MCGDSTSEKDVDALMNGEKAGMVFTDPPYNIAYEGKGEKTSRTIENDDMEDEQFREFLNKAFLQMKRGSKPTAPAYVCYASSTHREFEDALNKNGYEVRNQIVWVKSIATMTWGDYRWKHKRATAQVLRRPNPDNGTEWRKEPTDEELVRFARK